MKSANISSHWAKAGVFAAVAASLCCIAPVLTLLAGIGGLASTFSWLEPTRPFLIGVSIVALGLAWYQQFKPKQIETDCCAEPAKTSFWQSKSFLGVVTVFASLMLAFPNYAYIFSPKTPAVSIADLIGTNPNLVPDPAVPAVPAEQISFYQTPLVCGASSDIGCGSRSKPLLLDLESEPKVESAWLNHGGTLTAIVWHKDFAAAKERQNVVEKYGDKYAVTFTPIYPGTDFDLVLTDFNAGRWYKSSQVDQLSLIEAGIIADKVVRPVVELNALTPDKTDTLRTEVENYFRLELVKFRSNDELYGDSLRNAWQTDIENMVAKYVGQERLPELRIRFLQEKECKDKSKSCCKPASGESCCKQSN